MAIIDPADAVNHAACNALLKTLEEPQPGRYLWLRHRRSRAAAGDDPQSLPEARIPAAASGGVAASGCTAMATMNGRCAEALDAARGHPGLADVWLRDGGLRLRKEVVGDLAQLSRGDASPLDDRRSVGQETTRRTCGCGSPPTTPWHWRPA